MILINLSTDDQTIQDGDRIAQMVIQKVEKISWQQTDQLLTTERNEGGFGSTGRG